MKDRKLIHIFRYREVLLTHLETPFSCHNPTMTFSNKQLKGIKEVRFCYYPVEFYKDLKGQIDSDKGLDLVVYRYIYNKDESKDEHETEDILNDYCRY